MQIVRHTHQASPASCAIPKRSLGFRMAVPELSLSRTEPAAVSGGVSQICRMFLPAVTAPRRCDVLWPSRLPCADRATHCMVCTGAEGLVADFNFFFDAPALPAAGAASQGSAAGHQSNAQIGPPVLQTQCALRLSTGPNRRLSNSGTPVACSELLAPSANSTGIESASNGL